MIAGPGSAAASTFFFPFPPSPVPVNTNFLMKRDYYEILDVNRNATQEEVKKAFRKIALECHPDRCPGDQEAEERFKEAQEAYAVLSNPESRQRYDLYGFEGLRGQSGFADFGFSNFDDLFQDLFDSFFTGRGGRRTRRSSRRGVRGNDLRYSLRVSFSEAFSGADKEITLTREATCPECGGSGAKPGTRETPCPQCRGEGEVYIRQGFITLAQTCPACRGRGKTVGDFCPSCKGRCRVREEKKLTVKVPPGVESGVRLRIEGEGEGGIEGGGPGDLYIDLEVESHSLFRRDGKDIYLEVPLTFSQAALGAKMEVPIPEGRETVHVKPGVQTGETMSLKGKGMPSLNGYGRGNLYLVFSVETPTHLTKRQKEILSEFEQIEEQKNNHPRVQGFIEKVKELFRSRE